MTDIQTIPNDNIQSVSEANTETIQNDWTNKSQVLDFLNTSHICDEDIVEFEAMVGIIISGMQANHDPESVEPLPTQIQYIQGLFTNICGEFLDILNYHDIPFESLTQSQMLNCIGYVVSHIGFIGVEVDGEIVPLNDVISTLGVKEQLIENIGSESTDQLLEKLNITTDAIPA